MGGNSVADQSTWGNQGRGISYKAKAWTEQLAKAKKAAKKKGAKAKGSKKKTKESKPPTSGLFPQSDRYWNRKEFYTFMKAKPQTVQLAAKPKAKKGATKKESKPPTSGLSPQSDKFW